MIFISGIHGVGKTFFSDKIKEKFGLNTFTASRLISDYRNYEFQTNKKVTNIVDNQRVLLLALMEKTKEEKQFLLDGHFCLFDNSNNITRIEFTTYEDLQPDAIILLTEKPDIIVRRRKDRDNITIDINSTKEFQEAEVEYAKEVADRLKIPIFISNGAADIEKAMEFVIINI